MEPTDLQEIIQKNESPKLEFKKEWYSGNEDLDSKGWGEFLKDIIGLANGNFGYYRQYAHIIIGVSDKDPSPPESRETVNVPRTGILSDLQKLRETTLVKIRNLCSTSVPDLLFEWVKIESAKELLVIKIPPPSSIINLLRDLETRGKTYGKGTVLIRVGHDTAVANPSEIEGLNNEFKKSGLDNTIEIFKEFHVWITTIQPTSQDDIDRFFCCILPETAGEDLIDFTPQNIEWNQYSPMETYFHSLEIFPYAQTFADLEHLDYSDSYGNKLVLHNDGTLFIHIKLGKMRFEDVQLHGRIEKRPIWYTPWLFPDNNRYIGGGHAKYGLPIDAIRIGNFEDILKAICFAFNPACKIPLVPRPTDKFQGSFLIPNMLVGTQKVARYLAFEHRFPSFREYVGTKGDLEIRKTFRFSEISEVMESFKKGVEASFRDRSDTAYG